MDREQVAALDKDALRVWDGKFNGRCRRRVGSVLGCAGFPVQSRWGIVAGDFFAVDEGGESILVLQVQHQFIDGRQIPHDERNADINRLVVVPHLSDIESDAAAVVIPHAGFAGFPVGVVKVDSLPGGIVRAVHRDSCPGSRPLLEQYHLIPLRVSLAKRDIFVLWRVGRRELRLDAGARVQQREIPTLLPQPEIGVQRRVKVCPVFPGGKNDKIPARREGDRGEFPLQFMVRVVG
ncbi:MAG: hypothetical protein ABGY13_04600 [Verrucomicrobiia bacterium]